MSWKELPTMSEPEDIAVPSQTSTKRSNLIRRICSRCFKAPTKLTPQEKSSRSPPFEPIRRPSDMSTMSYDSSAASSESESPSQLNGPKGQGFEVPCITVLDPAGELIHGHGGSWGDFEERQPIGSGAGGFKTIRERMEMNRRARRVRVPTSESQVGVAAT